MELYEQIIELYQTYGSVNAVVEELKGAVSKIKVQRVLLTEGLWTSRTAEAVGELYAQGKSTAEIAEILCMSVKNVQSYIPYSKGSYGEKETVSSRLSRNYRERNRHASENMIHKKESVKEKEETMAIMTEDKVLNYNGVHLELDYPDPEGEEKRILQKYGRVKEHITRDIIVPGDITLHALNYAIQRAFGWQNSHLHHFSMDGDFKKDRLMEMTDNKLVNFLKYCGIYFRLPYDSGDQGFAGEIYYDEDYEDFESVKSWMKRKYTGPYHYPGTFELYLYSQANAEKLLKECRKIPVMQGFDEFLKNGKQKERTYTNAEQTDLRNAGLFFNSIIGEILERLPLTSVLTNDPIDWKRIEEKVSVREAEKKEDIKELKQYTKKLNELSLIIRKLNDIINNSDNITEEDVKFYDENRHCRDDAAELYFKYIDLLQKTEDIQEPFLNELYYLYDYGDGWEVRITLTDSYTVNLEDYINPVITKNTGEMTEEEKEILLKAGRTHSVKCLKYDGLPLCDDAGGVYGYIDFLRQLKEGAPEEKERMKDWGEIQGWSGRNIRPENLL